MTVPTSAVVRRSELSAVYVLGARGPRLRQVRLGHRRGDEFEVHAGLRTGERVVRDARAALRALSTLRANTQTTALDRRAANESAMARA